MLVTSLTSAVAFAACTVSDIMPIRAFGYFAAIVVPTVYFQTILVQPLNYYIYEAYIMNKCSKLVPELHKNEDEVVQLK